MSTIGGSRRIAYRRRASPLHAARPPIAAAYGIAIAVAALIVEHPLLLSALLIAVLLAATGAGVGRELVGAARVSALPILALTVLVNLLVNRNGLTVFARLGDWGVLGQVNLTIEALVYGLVVGLRLLVVTLACLLVVCAVDPDELLVACRRISPHSALTAALTTRLLPVLGEDARRLAEAQRCRPDGGARGARGKLAILRATVSGALERSLDVAAVLEMRGYGARPHAPVGRRRAPVGRPHAPVGRRRAPVADRARSRHDIAFAAAAAGLLGVALYAALSGAAPFHPYPLLHAPLTTAGFVLAGLFVALAAAPFANRRGIEP